MLAAAWVASTGLYDRERLAKLLLPQTASAA
jgi:hypothetical protein